MLQAAAIEHNYSTIPFTEHWVDHAVEVSIIVFALQLIS